MAKSDFLRNMVIKRLGELCQAHSEVVTEKALLEAKILETVKVLNECFLPERQKAVSDGGKG